MRWYKEIFFLLRNFGMIPMLKISILTRLPIKGKPLKNRNDYTLEFLEKFLSNEIAQLKKSKLDTTATLPADSAIWVCWLQGEENMPEIIKLCYRSLIRNKGMHKVTLISQNNYADYVTVPLVILQKYKKNFRNT